MPPYRVALENKSAPFSTDIARKWSREDGIILRVRIGAPKDGDSWSWQYSEDIWGEQEVLMKGPRKGDVEVYKP